MTSFVSYKADPHPGPLLGDRSQRSQRDLAANRKSRQVLYSAISRSLYEAFLSLKMSYFCLHKMPLLH